MVYLSMLIALEDDRVFREALDLCGTQLGVEFFSFRYSKEEMKSLRARLRSLSGHPMSFHGPMHTAELSEKKDSRQLQESFEAYRRALSLAQEVGAKYMVVHTHECFVRPDEKQERMKQQENIWNLAQLARHMASGWPSRMFLFPTRASPYTMKRNISPSFTARPCAPLIDLDMFTVPAGVLNTLRGLADGLQDSIFTITTAWKTNITGYMRAPWTSGE